MNILKIFIWAIIILIVARFGYTMSNKLINSAVVTMDAEKILSKKIENGAVLECVDEANRKFIVDKKYLNGQKFTDVYQIINIHKTLEYPYQLNLMDPSDNEKYQSGKCSEPKI